ncbi:MAG: hypothetical protein JWM34_3935 [Ilumatobacteraceae bacterium]|nr:hypothetical protein [Ilumatobacteraceae bacterium]
MKQARSANPPIHPSLRRMVISTAVAGALLGACSSSSSTKGSAADSVVVPSSDVSEPATSATRPADTTPREFATYDPKWANGICAAQLPAASTIATALGVNALGGGVDSAYGCTFTDATTKTDATFAVADAARYATASSNGATAGAVSGSLQVDKSVMIVYGGFTYLVDVDVANGTSADDDNIASMLLADWLGL